MEMAMGMLRVGQNGTSRIGPFKTRFEMAVQTTLHSTVVPDGARLTLLRSCRDGDAMA